ncbi:MAG: hypothetical protein KF857_08160 [Fimbriimonadaceae bacterium]|nr:hypothetical protein [Fimbriimonadaceae bacterium]
MKKFVAVAIAMGLMGMAMAQGTFTIRRPLDGSTVRETVKVRVPKNSIPESGYLGVVVNGKFLEAVMPEEEGQDYVYDLDTKARGIPDGPMNIELVLYQDMGEGRKPQVLNRSSVRVTLDNHTSIAVSEEGRRLRYKFKPGSEWVYNIKEQVSYAQVTQAQAALGSRPFETVLRDEDLRLLFAVDNSYSDSDGKEGLIRMQPLPTKGKDYAMLTVRGDAEPRKVMDYEMQPVYMRITDTGREVFGSMPTYFPMEGTAGEAYRIDLFALLPLPVLPTKAVKPGDVWQGTFLLGAYDLDKINEIDKLTQALPGRATFEGVEWQHGIPCAKLRTQVAVGAKDLKDVSNLGLQQGQANSVKVESLVWLAMDRGLVIRQELNVTQESLVEVAVSSGVGGGTGFGGPSGGPAGLSGAGGAGRGGKGGFGDGAADINRPDLPNFFLDPRIDENGQIHMFQQGPGRPPGAGFPGMQGKGGGAPGRPGAPGGTGFPGGATGGGGGQATQKQIIRVNASIIMELES